MKPATKWTLAGAVVALSAAVAAGGYGLLALLAGVWRQHGSPAPERAPMVTEPVISLVDLGLVGVIMILLAALATVLLKTRRTAAPAESREAWLVHDMYRGFLAMDKRVEKLEEALLQRAGRIYAGPRVN